MNGVEIDGLTYTYPGAPQPTLKEISLQIEKGDFLAVVGNNGCGKSTLCKALNGLIPHFITGTMEGSVRVEGLDTRESDVGVLAQKVGYRYAAVNKSVKKIKLAALKVTCNDGLFLAISFLVVAVAVLISTLL